MDAVAIVFLVEQLDILELAAGVDLGDQAQQIHVMDFHHGPFIIEEPQVDRHAVGRDPFVQADLGAVEAEEMLVDGAHRVHLGVVVFVLFAGVDQIEGHHHFSRVVEHEVLGDVRRWFRGVAILRPAQGIATDGEELRCE